MNVDSLNNILKLKEWTQESIEIELSRLNRMVKHHEETLRLIEQEYEREITFFREKMLKEPHPDSIKIFHAYFTGMNSKLKEHKEILKKRIEELKQTEQRLIKAFKERSLLEKLIDNEKRIIEKANQKKEQKLIDEIAVKRYIK